MKTEATNFNIGRGLLGETNFQMESEATLSARDFSCPVIGSKWSARYCCSCLRPSVGRWSFGQRPTLKHHARRTRGTTSRTQVSQSLMTNLVILLRQDAYITRVLGCENPVRLNLLCLFVISDKSAIFFKDLLYLNSRVKTNTVLLAFTALFSNPLTS